MRARRCCNARAPLLECARAPLPECVRAAGLACNGAQGMPRGRIYGEKDQRESLWGRGDGSTAILEGGRANGGKKEKKKGPNDP